MTGRVGYVEVGQAIRDAMQRMFAVKGQLSPADRDVFMAVVGVVGTYSRTTDAVTVDQVAEFARCARETANRSLRRLDKLGVISWRGARKGQSTVSLDVTAVVTTGTADPAPDVTAVVTTDVTAVVTYPRSTTEKKEVVADPVTPMCSLDCTCPDCVIPAEELASYDREHLAIRATQDTGARWLDLNDKQRADVRVILGHLGTDADRLVQKVGRWQKPDQITDLPSLLQGRFAAAQRRTARSVAS